MKLKYKELASYRNTQLQLQSGICPICLQPIDEPALVLDHNHKSGRVRMALHRTCNRLEGTANRYASGKSLVDKIATLQRLIQYWTDDISGKYDVNPFHPKHKVKAPKKKRK